MRASLIFDILIAFGAFQALFISIILLVNGKASLPKKLFSLFLIIEGITLVERLLVETDLIHSVPHILGISYPISFIKPPILFLAALAIVDTKFKPRKIHLINFIPFLIMLVMNIPFYFQSASYKLEVVQAFMDFVPTYTSFEFYLYFSFFLHIGIYIAVTIRVLRNYKSQVKNNKLANWYLNVLWIYSGSLIIGFIYFAIQPSGLLEIPFFNTISMLTMTFLVQSIAYSFLARSDIFNGRTMPVANNIEQQGIDLKYIKNKLENDKLYLEDSLNLADFSKSLNLSQKYVSFLINQHFGNSFKDLINHYRVEEAKSLMKQELHDKITLIDIAHDSGFNNKVSFYRAFKRYTGKSPSDYFEGLKQEPLKHKNAL